MTIIKYYNLNEEIEVKQGDIRKSFHLLQERDEFVEFIKQLEFETVMLFELNEQELTKDELMRRINNETS